MHSQASHHGIFTGRYIDKIVDIYINSSLRLHDTRNNTATSTVRAELVATLIVHV